MQITPFIIAAFLIWWWEQLRSLLPARLRADRTRVGNAIIARPGDDTLIELFWRRGKGASLIGSVDMASPAPSGIGRRPCLLHADAASLLERDLSLPLAAERDLEAVLGFELERLTPFSPAELIWSWRVLARDRARGRLAVRLSIIPLAPLRGAIEALAAAGIAVTAIETAPSEDPTTFGTVIPLAQQAPARLGWKRHARRAGWALAMALAIVATVLPLIRQSLTLETLGETEEPLRPRVQAAIALRKQLAARSQGTDIVASQLARSGDPLAALRAVTEILPDDTFLTTLTLSQRKLVMEGRSAAAARLIAALSKGPFIHDAAFAAPVTRDDSVSGDIFSIQAVLQPASPQGVR